MKWHGHLKTGENESKKQIPENSKHWVVVDKFLQDGIQRQKRKMVPRSHVDQFQNELNMFINYMKKIFNNKQPCKPDLKMV